MNISSIIVRVKPGHLEEVKEHLLKVDNCEHHLDDGTSSIVVTLEGDGVEEEVAGLKLIQSIPAVISAEMAFSYSEDELDKLKNNVELQKDTPEWLNDDSITAKQIKYQGDLKHA